MPDESNLLPDSPIVQLLSLRSSPFVKDMSIEQLREHIEKLKALATQPSTMNAKLNTEAIKLGGKPTSLAAKRKALLDSI